ncbi:acyltransferase family protein [Paramicrobacterium fandaimingii]|uniref:acyltransferase family protein n=1 Tax=Paramicrobacterium fandaimingii TaxID=2708079 RepID=UPI001422ECAB|nr:acyltransferase family protein [Microbacterium fandaimingii]
MTLSNKDKSDTALPTSLKKKRDSYLDNAKVILLMFVVMGHLIAVINSSGFADAAYKWIYSFHMPAFVAITGYLSRSYRGDPRQVKALITGVLVPYLVFQFIVRVEPWLFFGEPLHLNFFTPGWSSWFLLALFAWRLLVPVLKHLRYPVLFSVIIVFMSVLYDGISQGLSGARILSYLPFFALGLALTPERLEAFKRIARKPLIRIAALAYLAGAFAVMFIASEWVKSSWFMMSVLSNIDGDLSNSQHLVLRACVLAFTTSMLVAVLALVPQRQLFFTHMGSVTLTMYMLQGVTLMFPRHFIDQWDGWTWPTVILLMIAGVLYTLLLGSRPVQYLTKWLVDPIGTFDWLRRFIFKKEVSVEAAQRPV